MKKSYVIETSLVVRVEIDLGEIAQLIETLEPLAEAESNNYSAKDLLRKLKDLRRETLDEAKREFGSLATRY